MRQALDKTLRSQLESTVLTAREITETACREEIERLGIGDASVPAFLNEAQRKLRNRLRAHARQLGDKLYANGEQETVHLQAEMAYEQWHRMLFARFLEQNNLLMYDAHTPVTLDECAELADEEPDCASGWELAGRLAAKMLPQVFRIDSPVLEVRLAINHQRTLEGLINSLAPAVFQAQDSLGWCYQFWQTKRKEEVNKSGVKIGADELSPVTQLFTEPYMVSFLLDNALGAWWAKRRLTQDHLRHASSEQELRERAAIDGVPLTYLRFVKVSDEQGEIWQPAGGWYDAWPQHLSELKALDPCCGSGHFLVGLFRMLVPMRMALEKIDAVAAVNAVISENLYGLELDSRCLEIAKFAVSLEAWCFPGSGGFRQLPTLNVACSGISVSDLLDKLSESSFVDAQIDKYISLLRCFSHAPVLGSLIELDGLVCDEQKKMLLELPDTISKEINLGTELRFRVKGLNKLIDLLSYKYQFVVTNVPYLALRKQTEELAAYTTIHYPDCKQNLAIVFVERCKRFLSSSGCASYVCPQDWIFLDVYKNYRKNFLTGVKINFLAKLGVKSFSTPMWDMNIMLFSHGPSGYVEGHEFIAFDVTSSKGFSEKEEALHKVLALKLNQSQQLLNPDARIVFETLAEHGLLFQSANALMGVSTGDGVRFHKNWWEIECTSDDWEFLQGTVSNTEHYSGRYESIFWEREQGEIFSLAQSVKHLNHSAQNWQRGRESWGMKGVSISQMADLSSTIYSGNIYDCNCCAIIPKNQSDIVALWMYASSGEFNNVVRQINQALKVPPKTLLKIPFDRQRWESLASIHYPLGLPEPYSNDPSQWIFHGHPCASVIWDEASKWTKEGPVRFDETVLQVAVARLLGYQWPAELDEAMELADEQRELVRQAAKLNEYADEDGIVCLPAVRGEAPAHTRLEKLLVAAYEDDWKAGALDKLLTAVGSKSLDLWLRDKFFEQHCKLFQHRPFIWHIWDRCFSR